MITIKEHEKICQICQKPFDRESLIAQVRYLLYDIDGHAQEVLVINFHVECVELAAELEEVIEQGKDDRAVPASPAIKNRIRFLLPGKKPRLLN